MIWTVDLNVPYVSQVYPYADASNNDCGIGMLLMLLRYTIWRKTGIVPDLPTVNQVEAFSALAQRPAPKGLGFNDLIKLAKRLGYNATFVAGVNESVLKSYLNNGQPVGMLVQYDHILPSDVFNGAHFVVVKGYNDNFFNIHDPYHAGANLAISKVEFDKASDMVVGNSGHYQGLIA